MICPAKTKARKFVYTTVSLIRKEEDERERERECVLPETDMQRDRKHGHTDHPTLCFYLFSSQVMGGECPSNRIRK